MQKEIFEQPESIFNTMRGRICFEKNTGTAAVHQVCKMCDVDIDIACYVHAIFIIQDWVEINYSDTGDKT